jgi:carbon starvation protein
MALEPLQRFSFEDCLMLTEQKQPARLLNSIDELVAADVVRAVRHDYTLGLQGWGAILIMGVTDPLGGINTLFPLFGIANQLLAAIALAVCLAIVAGRGRVGALWVVIVPLAFAAVVTVTASMYKIFSSVPAIGYWAQNRAFSAALERGETSFGTAKNVDAMEAVVRNTFIQGTLSILFVVLTLIVLATAVLAAVRSLRAGAPAERDGDEHDDHEDPVVPSRIYAPAGFLPTPSEKELAARWAEAVPPRPRAHH